MKPRLGTVEFFVDTFDEGVTFLAQVILIEKYKETVVMRLQWPHMGTTFEYKNDDGRYSITIHSGVIEVKRNEEGDIVIPCTAIFAFDVYFDDSDEEKGLVGLETTISLMSLK